MDILSLTQKTKDILTPFIYGICIAYILNPSIKFFENKILIKSNYIKNRQNLKRIISITTTYLILTGLVVWLISYIIPEISVNTQDISRKITSFDVEKFNNSVRENIPIKSETVDDIITKINDVLGDIINNIPKVLNKVVSKTFSFASIILNVILGVVISIYILFDKENIAKFNKKLLYAFSNENISNNTIKFFKEANTTFEKFFVGKIIDSVIVGAIFFIGVSIINPPFTILLSIIIGVTNMIPFFGPFIGGIPVVLITLASDINHPLKALWITIFILALQQFDGNILGPKIIGDSIGVKPLGIIFAIIIGGALFGPAGMFFGVPIFAVIFTTFNNFIDKKYNKKYN